MNIIVSAFVTNINKNNRSIQTYIELGYKLFEHINTLKIVFIERHIYDTYFTVGTIYSSFKYDTKQFDFIIDKQTIFVFFERNDNYLYKYIDSITNFNICTDNPSKDTLEYMFVQCHKTEWVKMAIKLITHIKTLPEPLISNEDIFQFIWIDFGIYHMFNNNTELFNTELFNNRVALVSNKDSNVHNTVRIASCINPAVTYHSDIYRYIAWYFAGSVFGGSPESLLKFAELMKTECIQIIQERKHLMWEVNMWYLIYLKRPELFDPYLCNHNPSIIMNY